MMTDSFIERVITPKSEDEDATMNREFYGIEAVAQFEKEYDAENGGEN